MTFSADSIVHSLLDVLMGFSVQSCRRSSWSVHGHREIRHGRKDDEIAKEPED